MFGIQIQDIKNNNIQALISNKYTDNTLPLLRLLLTFLMAPIYFFSKPVNIYNVFVLVLVVIYVVLTCVLPSFRYMIGKYRWLRIIVDDIIILAFCNTMGGIQSPFIYLFYLPVLVNTINTSYIYLSGVMFINIVCLVSLGLIDNASLASILSYISGILVVGFFFKIMLDKDFHVLSRYAIRDGLTGLYTHRYFFEQLKLQIDNNPSDIVSLIMIDLNEFKRLNDEMGHLEGDRVLKRVAAAIQTTVRESDLVARYGGDEFAIILPGVGRQLCATKAEQIRNSITNLGYFSDVAIGCAQFPDEATTMNNLVEIADKRMYHEKRMQQNRAFIDSLRNK